MKIRRCLNNNNTIRKFIKNKFKYQGKKLSFSFKKVSVLIPLYNEEESLRELYTRIIESVGKINIDYEIYFIDDGSTDGSYQIIKEIKRKDKNVHYVSFRTNYGKSAALQVGFSRVSGDAVITMDADLQDDPDEIPNLLSKLDEGYDLVSGWKKTRYDPFIKRTTSKFFNYVTSVSSNIYLHDFNCGLKGYRGEVVKNVKVYGELHRYVPVLADWQGYKVTEIPVKHHSRKFGVTKFGMSRFYKGFVDLITVLFTTRYVKRPMHLFGLLGAISFIIGILINTYLTYIWIFHQAVLSNRPLLLMGMLLIIVGIQLFAIGLIGELIVHNFISEKEYTIKDSA